MNRSWLVRDIDPSDVVGGVKQVLDLFRGWYRNFQPDGATVGSWSFRLKDCDASLFISAAELWADEHPEWPPSAPEFLVAVKRTGNDRSNAAARVGTARLIQVSKEKGLRYGPEPGPADNVVRLWDGGRWAGRGRFDLVGEAAVALEKEQFFLVYQPIVDMETGKTVAAEALIRWNHPEQGLLLPNDFIPALEETGMINRVGEWVLSEACAQLAMWIGEGAAEEGFVMHVNVSRAQLGDGITSHMSSALEVNHLDAKRLCVEITETAFSDRNQLGKSIREISELGALIGMDDFGSGWSTLGALAELSIDVLKIDSSIIGRIGERGPFGERAGIVLEAVATMAKRLDLGVVAEGIENDGQIAELSEIGFRLGQGNRLGEPVAPERLPWVRPRAGA